MINKILLLLCGISTLGAGNLIKNGIFTEITHQGKPLHWQIWPQKLHPGASVVIDSTISRTGGHSIRITNKYPYLYTRVDQLKIPCKPHTRYIASCYVRGMDLHTKTGGGARMFIGPDGGLSRGIVSFGPGIEQFKRKVPPYWTFDWERFESTIFNSGNSRELGVTLYLCRASGTVWFDNIEIMEYTPNIQQEREKAIVRQIIHQDLTVVRNLLPEKRTEFNQFATALKTLNTTAANRQLGMPLYPAQRELGKIVGHALKQRYPQTQLLISQVVDPLAPQSAYQLPGRPAKKIMVEGLRGETEGFALNLTNCSAQILEVAITAKALPDLTLRLATHVETDRRAIVDDALVRLRPEKNADYRIVIPAGMTRQIYGTLKLTRHYQGSLHLNGRKIIVESRPSKTAIPAELPIDLFSYSLPYHNQKLAQRFTATHKMLTQMHDNTAYFYQFDSPQPVFDENGKLLPDKMDWSKTDCHLKMVKQPAHAILFLPVYSDPHTSIFLGKSHGKSIATFSPEWERRIIAYLRAVVPEFKKRGLGYDQLSIVMRDEPPEKDIIYMEKLAAIIRKADPQLKIYNNFHSSLTEKSIRRLVNACDIIAPELGVLTDRNAKIIRESGKKLQCYHVQNRNYPGHKMRDNFKRFHQLGLTGFSYWCFFDRNQEWSPQGAQSFSVVYRGDDAEWTPSKRSEGIREGAEDFTLLELLKNKNQRLYEELINQPELSRSAWRHQALQAL